MDGTGTPERRMLAQDAVDAARRASPEAFLRARYGADVFAARSGRSLRVDHVLRADRRLDGTWISCDWFGGGIGDNIALVRHVSGCSFPQAVAQLSGMQATVEAPGSRMPTHSSSPARPRTPRLTSAADGRNYLRERGISPQTIAAAEHCGALSYCRGAVIFLGRDHASVGRDIRLAALRYLGVHYGEDGKPMNKRDLAGSDKGFPVFLPGETGQGGTVAIVEGGTNALAVRDLWLEATGQAPSVIATGGVGVRNWIRDNGSMRAVLQGAGSVVVVAENETGRSGMADPEKQARTDSLRDLLCKAVAEWREGEMPATVYPPAGFKDAADWILGVREVRASIAADMLGTPAAQAGMLGAPGMR